MKRWAILFALVLAAICLFGYGSAETDEEAPETRYQEGMLLLSQNRFAEAAAVFNRLGGYEDSTKLTMYCRAAAAGETERYPDAFSAFEALDDYKDSKLMLVYYHGRLYETHAGYQEDSKAVFDDLSEAINYYQSILFFRDCEERIATCYRAIYDEGNKAEQAGDLQTAKTIFMSMYGYLDSGDRLTAVNGKLMEQELAELCPTAVTWEQIPEADEMIAGQDPKEYPHIDAFSIGKDADGKTAGYVINVTGKGFVDDIGLRIGYSPEGAIRGIAFTMLNETPGMGMNADRDEFKDQFVGKRGELTLTYYKIRGNDQEIEAVTGASMTSKAVVNAVNAGTEFLAEVAGAAKEPVFSGLSSETEMVATAEGFGGLITVKMTLKDQTVTELSIETPDEIMGQIASEEAFTGQFIGKKGPFSYGENGVDAISGATITSRAVLDAINQAYTVSEDAEAEVTDSMPVIELQKWEQDGETILKELAEAGYAVELKYDTEIPEEPKTAEAPDFSRPLYGSFMVEKETNFSIIRVYVDTKGSMITNCRITSEAKSAGSDFLTDEIKDEWARAIVENGTAETDVITGATKMFSAAAVIEAVNEILDKIK